MRKTLHMLRRSAVIQSQRAATAVEYGLIISLVVLAMIGALQSFAGSATSMWSNVAREVTGQ